MKDSRVSSSCKSNNSFFVRIAVLALALFSFLVNGFSQEEVIKVETDLIGFEVTVTDKDGKPVKGLQAEDFKVFEDGVQRKVDFFEPLRKTNATRPLALVFALDVSGSMTAEEMQNLRGAMKVFIDRIADYNSYFAVMSFGMNVKTLQPFTNSPDKLHKTFEKLSRDEEGLSTHTYDAVDDAIRLLRKKAPQSLRNQLAKKTIVLITDGFPVGDMVSAKTVIERANDSETSVYAVLLPSFSRLQGNNKPLPTPLEVSGLIEKTGGRTFYANEKNFEPLFKALAEEITSSYVLAFYPREEARSSGKFYEVKVEVTNGFHIKQNRNGYQIIRREN